MRQADKAPLALLWSSVFAHLQPDPGAVEGQMARVTFLDVLPEALDDLIYRSHPLKPPFFGDFWA